MLVWRGGTVLNKVGGYDGHVTNVNAYGDRRLEAIVYKAHNPKYMIRLLP